MNDPLFTGFFKEVESLIFCCGKILTMSSDYGKIHDLPSEANKKAWLSRSNDLQSRLDKLKIELDNNLKNSPDKIDSQLVYFRQFSRVVSESPPEWSAYYADMDKVLDDLCQVIYKIDVKYKMGDEKYR